MTIKKIVRYPDPVLKKRAHPVGEVTDGHRRLIRDMIETMKAAEGVGLAANQVGELERIIVFMSPEEDGQIYSLINPRIIRRRGRVLSEEGCLSFPNLAIKLNRSASVTVKGMDEAGKKLEYQASGLLARIIQHEIDHLDGIVFIDRLGYFKRRRITQEYLKNK